MRAAFFLWLALALPVVALAIRLAVRHTSGSKGRRNVVYGGCFCPPHKGDFEVIKALYDDSYDEIIIYARKDAELYHGYAFDVNKEILEMYIKEIDKGNRGNIKISSYIRKEDLQLSQLSQGNDTLEAVWVTRREGEDVVVPLHGEEPLPVPECVKQKSQRYGGHFRNRFSKALDACAYGLIFNPRIGGIYDRGTPIMYTSVSHPGTYFGVIENAEDDGVEVTLARGGKKTGTVLGQVEPVLETGDHLIYRSQTFGNVLAEVFEKTEAGYKIQFLTDPDEKRDLINPAELAKIEPLYRRRLNPSRVEVEVEFGKLLDEFLPQTFLEWEEVGGDDKDSAIISGPKEEKQKLVDLLSMKSKLG